MKLSTILAASAVTAVSAHSVRHVSTYVTSKAFADAGRRKRTFEVGIAVIQ